MSRWSARTAKFRPGFAEQLGGVSWSGLTISICCKSFVLVSTAPHGSGSVRNEGVKLVREATFLVLSIKKVILVLMKVT